MYKEGNPVHDPMAVRTQGGLEADSSFGAQVSPR